MPSTLTVNDIWPHALSTLQELLKRPSIARYMNDIQPLSFDGERLVIAAANTAAKGFLEKKPAEMLATKLTETFGTPITVQFTMKQLALSYNTADAPAKPAARRPDDFFASNPLNPRYTFDSFVVGKNNQIANAASEAVSKAPGQSINPLFIYGGVGLGKTHLMQAIGHAALAHNKAQKISYISGDTFTYHVVSSIREDRFSAFREAYRDVDIWLVDDIQFIASRERTESEFFHTFNTLYETGKQIVITSDVAPKDLQIVDPRLRSRFESGFMTDIKAPDLETRIAILQKRVAQEKYEVSEDVIRYIANTINANIRALEGALVKVLTVASFLGEEASVALAMEQLRDHSTHGGPKTLSIADVQQVVVQHFGIALADLTGTCRTQNLVVPRQIAMYLCRQLLESSFPEIARKFGGRDHSTVMYACTKLEQTVKMDRQTRAIVSELTSRLQEMMR